MAEAPQVLISNASATVPSCKPVRGYPLGYPHPPESSREPAGPPWRSSLVTSDGRHPQAANAPDAPPVNARADDTIITRIASAKGAYDSHAKRP